MTLVNTKPRPPHIIVVCGPTATGKSDLAVALAQQYNGEVISADSRQVYRGLDIGSGKITPEEMCGIPHHLLDVANPRERFSVERYRTLGRAALDDILSRGKTAIICGGTGFYIDALFEAPFPSVPPHDELRARLKDRSLDELLAMLDGLDPRRAADMRANPAECRNRVRIIRAIEIATSLGAVPTRPHKDISTQYDDMRPRQAEETLWIGLTAPMADLEQRIKTRLDRRIDAGMIAEVQHLHEPFPNGFGVSWERLDELGLEYRFISAYLQKLPQLNTEERRAEARKAMRDALAIAIRQYARRQMTWFKRNARIRWIDITAPKPFDNLNILM